jgi:fumarate reductase flavoprotein subunit
MSDSYDIGICGAGPAGMITALFAARRGARVLLVDAAPVVGGTGNMSGGTLAGGQTKRQAERGIDDSPDAHFQDIIRLGHNVANPAMVRLVTEHAPALIDWMLDNGFEMADDVPQIDYQHEAYSVARTYWGKDRGKSLAKFFEPLLRAEHNITLMLSTRMTGLVSEPDGTVTGLRLKTEGGELEVSCRRTLLATGGYANNQSLFARLTGGRRIVTGAYIYNTGEGIESALEMGAAVTGGDHFLPKFGGVEDPPGSGRLYNTDFPSMTVQVRPPWEIFVNTLGERFVREDHPSIDARERSLLHQPDMTFWIVFDQAIFDAAPSIFRNWDKARWAKAWAEHRSFVQAPDIETLAERMNVPAAALVATIADYNAGQARGEDRLGRTHMPAPIAQPPFYAVKNHGTTYTSCAGLLVDETMRVLRPDRTPIPNLYAAGEILGRELISGDAYVGGMSITPALVFGRLLGETILTW